MRNRYMLTAIRALVVAGVVAHAQAGDPPTPAATHASEPAAVTPTISTEDLAAALGKENYVILDVRTPEEFAAGHVPGARNITHDQVAVRLEELSSYRDRPVVVYCRSGRRAALAEDILRKAGFERLLHLEGDFTAWQSKGHTVERAPPPADAGG